MPRDEVHAEETLETLDTFEAFPIRCHACKARDRARTKWDTEKGNTDGLLFGLRRRV